MALFVFYTNETLTSHEVTDDAVSTNSNQTEPRTAGAQPVGGGDRAPETTRGSVRKVWVWVSKDARSCRAAVCSAANTAERRKTPQKDKSWLFGKTGMRN